MSRLTLNPWRRFLSRTVPGRAVSNLLTLVLICQLLVSNQAPLLAADAPAASAKSAKQKPKARTTQPVQQRAAALLAAAPVFDGATLPVGSTVQLDGSASSDPDGHGLTYRWSLTVKPTGSTAALSDPTAANPTFVADRVGVYVAQLIVDDGVESSAPASVAVTVFRPTVSVPDVVGLTQSAAEAGLVAVGLVAGPITTASSMTVPAGRVISQNPAAGATVPTATEVSLVVSLGPPPVTVPTVVGLPQAQAQSAIVAAQLIVGTVTTSVHPTVPAGRVIIQLPVGGSSAPAGSAVDLVVSLGPTPATVPNVVGLPQAQAQTTILAAQLIVGLVTTANHPSIPAGSVISQNPSAGSSVPVGSPVSLVVSLGIAPPVLTSIAVTPATATLMSGQTQQFTATGNYSDSSTQNLTSSVVWTSNPVAIANITPTGLASALDPGTATISASKDGITGTATLTVNGPALASIVITPATPTILVGQTQSFSAFGILTDGTSQDITASVTWTSSATGTATIAANGTASGLANGTANITATSGLISASTPLAVRTTVTDPTPPTVAITAPANNSTLTTPTDIVGTANDANFLKYILELAPAGETGFVKIAESTSPVVNGILGKFDPTNLFNDLYTVRLRVFDLGGNVTTASVTYQAARDQKVGLFSLAFEDLQVPLSGIPITITRSYDSRDKRTGDFGVGWRLEVKSLTVRPNRIQGTAWQVTRSPGIIPTYTLVASDQHKVSISLPDGSVEEFDLTPTPSAQVLIPLQFVTPAYTARPGTLGRLVPTDTSDLLVTGSQPGPVDLLDFENATPYDPQSFQYTSVEGQVYNITRSGGVQSTREPNGNTLTFGPGGIIHSSGRSVTFQRDGQGRITRITDPNGNAQTYSYNSAGDLVTHTDVSANSSRYLYNLQHGLIEIRDPRGFRPARNEYDDQGRLLATIDAEGNRIELDHQIDTRQEIVRNRNGGTTIVAYDASGKVLSERDPLGHTKTYSYDPRGNQLTETDPLGNTTSRTYDASNNELTKTDALGHVTSRTFAGANVGSVTDANGKTTAFQYDASGNPTNATDALGNITASTYGAGGKLLSRTEPGGRTTTYTNDAFGRRLSEVNPAGQSTAYTYDNNGNITREARTRTDANGTSIPMVTTRVYDAANRIVQETDPNGAVVRFEYNSIGKKSAEIDALGRRTEFLYDARGNLSGTRYPDGTSDAKTYDRENNLLTETDREGRVTRFAYDAANQLLAETYPDGSTKSMEYDAGGRVIREVDGRGNATTHQYDAAGRKIETTDALGNITRFVYDPGSNLIQRTDPNGSITGFEYDGLNRLTRTVHPDGLASSATYNAAGQKATETDRAGNTTQFAYDALDRLTGVTDALGQVTTYTYDEAGNRLSQTDANGRVTRWTYDNKGRVLSRQLPEGMAETLTYDAKGNALAHRNFNGATIAFSYDVNDRLVRKSYPDGTTVEYTYTATGKPATVLDSRGLTRHRFDARDRVAQVENPDGTTLTYGYDAAGNRTSLAAPSGITLYTYDALNRPATVVDRDNGTTTYSYDPAGNRLGIVQSNGTRARYTYDALGRLTRLANEKSTGEILSSYDYTLGPAGNRTRVTEHTGRIVNYAYDAVYRLVQEETQPPGGPAQTVGYTYDAVGNRLTRTDGPATTTYTYDANDRLLTEGDAAYTYDQNGNSLTRTEGGVTSTFTYDFDNRLATAVSPGSLANYAYEPDGTRIAATVNGATIQYVVDKNREYSKVIEERSPATGLLASYVVADDLIAQLSPAGRRVYHADALGSIRLLTDAAQAIADTYTYDAFGRLTASTGATANPFRFAGEQFDLNTGFYFLRARYLNPETGRFLTQDPTLGFPFEPASLHKYAYVHNDPVNQIDPSGQFISFAFVGSLSRGVFSALANVRLAFLISRSLGGAAIRTLGVVVENAVGTILTRIPGAVVQRGIVLVGAGGRRVIDFLVTVGNRVALIEVKYGLPRQVGPALTRLVGQIQTSLTATNLPAGTQIVLFTFRAPSPAQMALLAQQLGPNAGLIQHVSGLWGLVQWARFFFLAIP